MPPRVLPKSFNWKAVRIVGSLRNPDQPPEDLLDSVSFRQADGQEALLQEFPIAELLSVGETVQAEEFVLQIPDGRSATVVPNATPIICSQGAVESSGRRPAGHGRRGGTVRLRADFLAVVRYEIPAPLTSIMGSPAIVLDSSTVMNSICPPAQLRFSGAFTRPDQNRSIISGWSG